MAAFAVIAFGRWFKTGFLFFALVAARDCFATYFLIFRRSQRGPKTDIWKMAVAYLSSALPLIYMRGNMNSAISNVLMISGFALSTVALLELGSSFGVAPANRGFVKTGVYRYLSHPIYVGYGIAEAGAVASNPQNIAIFGVSAALYLFRGHLESKQLQSFQ